MTVRLELDVLSASRSSGRAGAGSCVELAHLHDLLAQLGALLVDRGDHRAHRHAEVDQHRLGQLQRGFERLGHRVGRAGPVELGGMLGVAGAGDDGEVGAPGAHLA